jgi:hypothetical protein
MRNVFIVPTDDYSKLFLLDGHLIINTDHHITPKHYQHIYITSSEDIKEDDWGLSKLNEVILFGRSYPKAFYKKIILTTDPILIENGVQAIDDEFLDWFIKHPTREYVEVELECFYQGNCVKERCLTHCCNEKQYKIIIPQEEPKQYPIGGFAPGNYMNNCITCKQSFMGDKRATQCETCAIEMVNTKVEVNSKGGVEIVKQETLEEAAERYANEWEEIHPTLSSEDMTPIAVSKIDFIAGANYYAEKMYSEADLREAFKQSRQCKIFEKDMPPVYNEFEDWFGQFKKK